MLNTLDVVSLALLGGLMIFQTVHLLVGAWRHFADSPRRGLIVSAIAAFWLTQAAVFLTVVPSLSSYEAAIPWVVTALFGPSVLALIALAVSPKIREVVSGFSLRWLIESVEGPARILVGSLFIVWFFAGALPGVFAWVAGPGDIIAGFIAFYALTRLQPLAHRLGLKDRHFSAQELIAVLPQDGSIRRELRRGVLLAAALVGFGILDFFAAPGASAIGVAIGQAPEALGSVPLGLVPMFLVPQVLLLEVLAMSQLWLLWRASTEAHARAAGA